jgi:NADPH2:quinone reductase
VTEFKKGDRVAAFHVMMSDHGSFAQYSIAPQHTTFHIPEKTSFEEAATLPLAAMTSVIGMFDRLQLPTPLAPAKEELPLLVYGGSSAVGAFVIKLSVLANIHPIIAVAGSGGDYAKSIGADHIVDYRNKNVVEDIKKILGGKKLLRAYDAISEGDSVKDISAVLADGGLHTTVLPVPEEETSTRTKILRTMVGDAHSGAPYLQDLASAYYRLFGKWLQEGRFEPHPYEVVKGGLQGVEEGLRRLQEGKVSAKKLVFRIADTPGLKA